MRNPLKNTEPMRMNWKKTSEHEESRGMSWSVEYHKGEKWLKAWRPSSSAQTGFRVSVGEFRKGTSFKKSFKTKSQALAFAKSYMRTH